MGKKWLIITLIILGIILGVVFAVYDFKRDDTSETNTLNSQRLADSESNAEPEDNVIETFSVENKISPNAIIIEKRYYKVCDHLIREVIEVPEELINGEEEDVQKAYPNWKIEGFSPSEIVVYKEFNDVCNEHYVIKERDGIVAIYTEDTQGVQTWQEDTDILMQYLPDEDRENFTVGVKIVGKTNLSSFLENYE